MVMNTESSEPMACKYCQSSNIIKFGTYKDVQRYFCKDCKRKFKDDDSLLHGKVPADDIASALNEYYTGMSVNDIRGRIKQEKGYYPSQSTVYQWIEKFTGIVVKHFNKYYPVVGDVWIADETVLDLDGKDVWLWDVICDRTRFLLATKMSYTRTSEDVRILFQLAKERAGKEPEYIITDKLRAYPEGIRQALKGTIHKQSKPFTESDSTNKIERFHSTLKERTKVMRGLKDAKTALSFTDGFLAYYNFLRPHGALDGQTPAEAAGIKYDVKNWTGVIRLREAKRQLFLSEGLTDVQVARKSIPGKPYKSGRKRKHRIVKPVKKLDSVIAPSIGVIRG